MTSCSSYIVAQEYLGKESQDIIISSHGLARLSDLESVSLDPWSGIATKSLKSKFGTNRGLRILTRDFERTLSVLVQALATSKTKINGWKRE